MSNSVPTAANQADCVLAEHAAEIRRLHEHAIGDVIEIGRRLTECKRICGHGNWLPWLRREFRCSGSAALRYMQLYEMSKSVTVTDLDAPIKSLYLLAAPSTPETARTEIIKRARSGEAIPPSEVKRTIDAAKGREQPVERAYGLCRSRSYAWYREAKLGEDTVEKLKSTCLASAREQDALVFLNRGAAEGEHTEVVDQLVADAVAGKNVSAIEVKNNGVPPPHDDDGEGEGDAVAVDADDDDNDTADHAEEAPGPEAEAVLDGPRPAGRPPRPSKSPDRAALAETYWALGASLNDIDPASLGEIKRKLARLRRLETENARLRSEVEDLRSENVELRSEVKDLRSENVELRSEVKDLRSENADLCEALERGSKEFTERTDEFYARSEVKDLRSENANLREALDEANKKSARVSDEFVALRDRMGQPAPPRSSPPSGAAAENSNAPRANARRLP